MPTPVDAIGQKVNKRGMGNRAGFNRFYEPTIGEMARRSVPVFVECTICQAGHRIDLAQLIERVGPDYLLWNRRCRCRLTGGCPGWNRFLHQRSAVLLPMWDDETAARWTCSPC